MKKSVLAVLVGAVLLNGCNDYSIAISGPSTDVPGVGDPDLPAAVEYELRLTLAGSTTPIYAANCDGAGTDKNGVITQQYDENTLPSTISCYVGSKELTTFEKGTHYLSSRSVGATKLELNVSNSSVSGNSLENIQSLLLAVDVDGNSLNGIQLRKNDETSHVSSQAIELFEMHVGAAHSSTVEEFNTNNISVIKDQGEADKQPGHGTDIVPEFTPGNTDVSAGGLVSANAESAYQYVPEKAIPEVSRLVMSGKPVEGIDYYGPSYRGVTNEKGEFEYQWGEKVTFGIEALTLGDVTVKGIDVELKQLSNDSVIAANIETFIKQFDAEQASPWLISKNVHLRFAQESNNIVEKINFSLANGAAPESQPTESWGPFPPVENEFLAQFDLGGSAADIIQDLNLTPLSDFGSFSYSPYVMARDLTAAQELNVMMGHGTAREVTQFHVFAHQHDGYRMPGPMAATFINISNFGAPVVMPRNDINSAIPFGGLAIKDKFGRSFPQLNKLLNDDLSENINAPSYIDAANKTYWNPKTDHIQDSWYESSYEVNDQTATFGLPFVMTGKIGKGRLLVLGNTLYNSILVSPFSYSDVNHNLVNSNGKDDGKDMFNFMVNSFTWLAGQQEVNIATNRETVYFAQRAGHFEKPLQLAQEYLDLNWNLSPVSILSLSPESHPIYLLQAYAVQGTNPDSPDLQTPLLTDEEVTHLINYVNGGGHIVIMESLRHKSLPVIGRLLDTAGISAIGRTNEVGGLIKLPDSFRVNPNPVDGQSMTAPVSSRPVYDEDVYVLESISFSSDSGDIPSAETPPEKGFFYDRDSNTYYWGKKSHESKTVLRALFRPSSVRNAYHQEAQNSCKATPDVDQASCVDSYLTQKVDSELTAWKNDLKEWYGVKECTNFEYDYELDCIETRKGNGIPLSRTSYPGANDMVSLFKRLEMSSSVSEAMIEAANMGTNLDDLYQHELYYRSNAAKGKRLSSVDVERIYGNLSAWMWNDYQYRFDGGKDEFGHQRVVEYFNCYSNDQYGNPSDINAAISCPQELKDEMVKYGFLVSPSGNQQYVLNPSYPLNYMEKPFTRMLLGRSYFDAAMKERGVGVDVREYPGVATRGDFPGNMTIHRGSRQSTGVWIAARETAYISGLQASDSVMIAMADNLTGRVKHEMALKRPPRVSVTFNGAEASNGFEVPYGGLVYITVNSAESAKVSFSGAVQLAPLFKMTSATEGHWITSPEESDAPLTEIVANRFVYTTTTKGVSGHTVDDVLTMAKQLDLFTISANEFYGRDATSGTHAMFTDSSMPYINMRMVDDAQISIGAAHSGYPVMVDRFPRSKSGLINASTDWLVGHEIGHNLATNWFNVEGAGETANNLLALYNQDRNLGDMPRIKLTIKRTPEYVKEDAHPWANGSNAHRLNFFGQLKIWAEDNFQIEDWETSERLALTHSIYNKTADDQYDQGWNFIKLVHRMAREGELVNNETNYCSAAIKDKHSLTQEGMLMVCSSYLTKTDLSDFFTQWNVGEYKQTINFEDKYFGGVSLDTNALTLMETMKKDGLFTNNMKGNPLDINQVPTDGGVLLPQQPYW